MNTKVTQMMELLFRDVAPSEEVTALREEVQNNCQDRFEDLVRGGLSEEEALAAVMESLKGMEDVLKEYPRKDAPAQKPEEAPAGAPKAEEKKADQPDSAAFPAERIRAIQARLTGCDVEVLAGGDGVTLEKQGPVHYELEEDGTLKIWQERITGNLFQGISWEQSVTSFEHFGDAMNRLAQNITNLVSGKLGELSGGTETRLTLRLPEGFHPQVDLRTMSGDIAWSEAVPGGEFVLGSTSGDLQVRIDPEILLPGAECSSTSGDAELCLSAETARISTVSGDIRWKGDAGALEINSTSGDVDAEGRIRLANLKSTSGDLHLTLGGGEPAEVNANTVSGSVHVRLTGDPAAVQASLKTVSGTLRTQGVDLAEEAPVTVAANTVSGSLRISR